MRPVVRFKPLAGGPRQEVELHPSYTLFELHELVGHAVEYGGKLELLTPSKNILTLTPTDYAMLAVVDGEEA